jgi:hypothetical protein
METYLRLPAIRITRPAFRVAVYLSAAVSMFSLFILAIKVVTQSFQQHFNETGGVVVTETFSNVGGVALFALFALGSLIANAVVVSRDEKCSLPFQLDGRDENKDGSRKWITMPSNQFSLAAAALMPFVLIASGSSDLGFMQFAFYAGIVIVFLTVPAVVLVRTLRLSAVSKVNPTR